MPTWHPIAVHFAIALLPSGCALDLVALALRRSAWHRVAYGLLLAGTAAAALSVLTGNAAAGPFRAAGEVAGLIERHEDLGTLSLLIFLVVALGRMPLELQQRYRGWSMRLWIAVSLGGNVALWLTGGRGGELVFVYGVGVGITP